MAPVRLRHPKGVSTLDIPLDDESFTVQAFQQKIYSVSDILPSRQAVKTGYPPQALTMIPELPFSSLGIQRGDQIIVSEVVGTGPSTSSSSTPATATTIPPQVPSPARPLAAAVPTPQLVSSDSGPVFVNTGDGSVLVHRVVPDDNSCLFSATALIFEQSIGKAQDLRKIVASGIQADPETYNEAILGMPPPQYIQTILKPTTWGGAIELGILAKHYGAEIASIDVETGRADRFSPPDSITSGMRCIVIYSGIHYDAASLAPMAEAPNEWHQTLFPMSSADSKTDPILMAAGKLADILRARKAYTNTTTFDLKCEQCGKGLKGEKEARVHAEQTGHVRFGEY
ncbi:OTU-domain-containing protein [Macrolepiota fuliginosa MF-IS2]|uniref:Ubiquitin thioesterase OTU n=1 Tax=Macrolepiota fuliginosa MF-IS2 TaxID=1400762 RepID=A0A9P5XPM8_9AGAR|nr:OTU-domain-containing protein [Macrolepiota fuliginosa MF-IS2]